MADAGNRILVVLEDVLAGTGDGEFVEELEEGRTELFEQGGGLAFTFGTGPFVEGLLGVAQGFLKAADADGVPEGVVAAFG